MLTLEKIPECLADATQNFTSMYKFAMGCTALKSVPRLYTDNVTNFVYAFYGCTDQRYLDYCKKRETERQARTAELNKGRQVPD